MDIVERLRQSADQAGERYPDTDAMYDAADEIKALRERNETLQAEVERLRRQLVMG